MGENMGKLLFITGGARSGKSDYALVRAQDLSGTHIFLATCPVIDQEMEERISRHKEERKGLNWRTIEEEIDLSGTICSLPPDIVCLIDCLTLWVNNLMYNAEQKNVPFTEDDISKIVVEFIESVKKVQGTVICVSNEVGLGVVPDNPTARKYRDVVGRCNRLVAAAADEVVLVSCGLPLFLKQCSK